MEFTVRQIATLLQGVIQGDSNLKVNGMSNLQDAKPNQITFLSNPKYESFIYETAATVIIVKADFVPKGQIKATLILVEDPYSGFTTLLEEYQRQTILEKSGIEKPCYQGKNAEIGKNIYQGAFSYIGDNVKIGNNVKIYPHTFIGEHTVIGNNTILYSGVKLHAHTSVGDNCTIHSGAVLGSDGFGFAPQKDGSYKSIPQLGNVTLGDNVNIGANTVIDCATLFGHSTTIKSGVKLDNLVQVAHNVEIGKNTVIAGQVGVSGSSKIGAQCVIAGQVGIAGHLTIADHTTIGAQAGVMKSINKKGEQLLGSPTLNAREYLKSYAVFKRLPNIDLKSDPLEKPVDTEN